MQKLLSGNKILPDEVKQSIAKKADGKKRLLRDPGGIKKCH